MNIDPRIEQHVREVYRGVIGKDPDRMMAAVRGLAPDDNAQVLAYGVFVLGYTIRDLFPDGASEADLRDLAAEMVESESWADLGSIDGVTAMLQAAATPDLNFPRVPRDDLVGNIFVAGGYMLGCYRGENQKWSEYLDEVWQAALAAPEPN